MSNKKDFQNRCFSPNWIEVNLDESSTTVSKEVRLESRRRKDLNTLLKELDDIRQNIERIADKQQRLANLMSWYSEEFAN